jgi:nucleotide-binding universal stress UspA family protein
VVAHAPCSVLIVPRGAAMWQQRVLVAAEPGAQGQQLVALAGAVAAECRLPISVVTVAEPGREAQAQSFVETSVAQLRQRGLGADGRTLSGKPYEQILQAGRDLGADLIVMGSRGDAHLGRALIGGVAQKVIGLAEHPVLVAHTDWHENKESAT